MIDFGALAAPFRADAIHWRAQSVNKDGNAAMALAYIDARDVQARLDEVAGPENWSDSYFETPKGRLICTLSLRHGDEWIGKSDGAGDTDVEGDKGAISDALKRAAVKWGIGRYLYDMPAPWAACETYERNGKKVWKCWTAEGLRKLQSIASQAIPPRTSEPDPSIQLMLDGIAACDTISELRSHWERNAPAVETHPDFARVVAAKDARKVAINAMDSRS